MPAIKEKPNYKVITQSAIAKPENEITRNMPQYENNEHIIKTVTEEPCLKKRSLHLADYEYKTLRKYFQSRGLKFSTGAREILLEYMKSIKQG